MSLNSMKKLEEKIAKKKIKLENLIDSKNKLESKIKKLRMEIEGLQSNQFEQFKKVAKKENIEISVDNIPEILQLLKNFQQPSKTKSTTEIEQPNAQPTGLRTLDSLNTIESILS